MRKPNIAALIISAGYSSRMGNFKPLMLIEGIPFIITVIGKTSHICHSINIVIGHRARDIKDTVQKWLAYEPEERTSDILQISAEDWKILPSKVKFIHNQNYELGMFSSLKIGLENIKKTEWILYHFVDQPHIPVDFYKQFMMQIDDRYSWIQPRFQHKNAHPILFRNDLAEEICKTDISNDLKSFSKSQNIRKKFWNCNYPQVLSDFDTPDSFYSSGEKDEYL
jgi:CTP:molybdopterin cytidylyltransferase MocA